MSDFEDREINETLDSSSNGGNPIANAAKNAGNQVSEVAKQEVQKQVQKKVSERLAKEGVKQAAAHSAGATSFLSAITAATGGTIWIVIGTIVAIIVILIIFSGVFMFLATMPGMVMDNLKGLFKEAGSFLAVLFGADTTERIDNSKIYQTLDYLDDMGWDVKGDGFLTKYIEDEADLNAMSSNLKKAANLDAGYYIDDLMGVVRRTQNPEGEEAENANDIILAESDFIFTYIMSDNYIYTIKNENIAVQDDEFKGVLNWLDKIGERNSISSLSCL